MATLSVQYTWTMDDWRQWSAMCRPRSRWSMIIRIILCSGLIGIAIFRGLNSGFDTSFWLGLLVAAWIGLSDIILVTFVMGGILLFYHPRITVSLDEQNVTSEWKSEGKKKPWSQVIRWTSFSGFGTAVEFPAFFLLQCGRGSVLIPKHAFLCDEDMDEFRHFVADKMGTRCKFRSTPSCASGLPAQS